MDGVLAIAAILGGLFGVFAFVRSLDLGALRRSDILRRAGFPVLVLAMGRVFLIDLSGLDGLWRATAFLGLGAAVVGIAILYQRLNRAPG